MQSFVNINPLRLVSQDTVDPFGCGSEERRFNILSPQAPPYCSRIPWRGSSGGQRSPLQERWNPMFGIWGMPIPNPPRDFSGRLRLEHVGGALETREQIHTHV